MNKYRLKQENLKEPEINLLMSEIENFPNIVYVTKDLWKNFDTIYTVRNPQEELLGVSNLICFDEWVQIENVLVRKKFHGRGIGKFMIRKIVKELDGYNFFIYSSNPSMQHIVKKFGFKEKPIFKIPNSIKISNIKKILKNLNLKFALNYLKKLPIRIKLNHKYFFKYKSS